MELLAENIGIGADRASEIISSLRDYSRPDDKTVAGVDIHNCIELALKILHNRHKKEITIARRKKAINSETIVFPFGLSLVRE